MSVYREDLLAKLIRSKTNKSINGLLYAGNPVTAQPKKLQATEQEGSRIKHRPQPTGNSNSRTPTSSSRMQFPKHSRLALFPSSLRYLPPSGQVTLPRNLLSCMPNIWKNQMDTFRNVLYQSPRYVLIQLNRPIMINGNVSLFIYILNL